MNSTGYLSDVRVTRNHCVNYEFFECELWLFRFWKVPIERIRMHDLQKAIDGKRNMLKYIKRIWWPFATVKWFRVRTTAGGVERERVV